MEYLLKIYIKVMFNKNIAVNYIEKTITIDVDIGKTYKTNME